jgi:hypothetical protein
MTGKNNSGWKIWVAAATAAALSFFAVIALAQTTGGPLPPLSGSTAGGLKGGTSGGGAGGTASGGAVDNSHSSGVGLGISIDVTKLLSPDSHETRPANEWTALKPAAEPGSGREIVVFRPDVPEGKTSGTRIEIGNSGHVEGGEWVVNWKPGMGRQAVTPLTPEGKPCPPKEETDRLNAENDALKKQIDALKTQNDALKSAAGEATVCKEKVKDCEKKLADAQSEITRLRAANAQAAATAQRPGDGAKAIYIPFSVTYDGAREVDHSGWDVIRAVFDGNTIRVENHTEEWLRDHPGGPKDQDDWLRKNYGTIPSGHIDFGNTLFAGQTLRDRIEHLCEPPPTLDELKAKKSASHILGIHYNRQTQQVSATSDGEAVAVTQPQIKETGFDLDLTAECLWTYDEKTGVVKKQVTIQLAVQYQDENGEPHEVKYVADNPQMGWIMNG